MADNLEQTQSTAEVVAPVVPAASVVAPAETPAAQTQQQQSREEVYRRYYEQNNPPAPTPEAPAAPAVATAPVETPTTETVPIPSSAAGLTPEAIKAIVIEAMKTAQTQPAPATTAAAPTTPVPVADANAWIQALIGGDFDGASNKIVDLIRDKITPDIQKTTIAEAVGRFKAETELNTFVNSIRESNKDIIQIEPLIAPKIQMIMSDWVRSQGSHYTDAAYVEQYKTVATTELNEARKILQTFRAAGAGTQQAVKQEVLSASTLAPAPAGIPTPTGPTVPQPQSTADYMAQRNKLSELRNRMHLKRQ